MDRQQKIRLGCDAAHYRRRQKSNVHELLCKEAYPIYSRYSTKAVEQTLTSYSKFSIPYPYPTAISVEAANGMEYPMICFNPGRAEEDGTYTEQAKNECISVVIHEVGTTIFQ